MVAGAWSANTRSTRNSQWKQFGEFCNSVGLVPVPALERTVARFLMYKARSCKYNTVNNYLSAINALHKCYGKAVDFRDSFLIQMILSGLKNRPGEGVVQKIPLSPSELLSMYSVLDRASVEQMTYWSALVFCFRSLLRKSNVLPSSADDDDHLVCRSDISFKDWGLVVDIRSSKTLRYQERCLQIPITVVEGSPLCAVSLLRSHFSLFPGHPDGPLFYKRTSAGNILPVKYQDVLRFLKLVVAKIGKNPDSVGLHSMRRSGAFFLHQIGVPLEDIKSFGDWKSMAALMYLVSPLDRMIKVDGFVSQALLLFH